MKNTINTPFGPLETNLYKREQEDGFGVQVWGNAVVGRTEYRSRIELRIEHNTDWTVVPSSTSLTRTDGKDVPYSQSVGNAFIKFKEGVLNAWKVAIIPTWISAAIEEKRQTDIKNAENTIDDLTKKLEEQRQLLKKLKIQE